MTSQEQGTISHPAFNVTISALIQTPMKKIASLITVFVILIGIALTSCKKDDEPEGIDKEMYDMARVTDGFTWYKNSSDLLDKSTGSGHTTPFLRTRYNTTAAEQLDAEGKVKDGAVFTDGSLVVKELVNSTSDIERYAILYKKSGDPNADANGWVWGYIDADGSVAVPAAEKGSACIGCHSQEGNIDYMLMNKFFP